MTEKEIKIDTEKTIGVKQILSLVSVAVCPAIVFVVSTFIFSGVGKNSLVALISLGITGMISLFIHLSALYRHELSYNNDRKLLRYFVSYLVALLLTLVQVYMPVMLWFFLPVAVALALFSSSICGIVSYASVIILQAMVTDFQTQTYLLYFLVGVLGIILFHYLNAEFQFGLPLGISLLLTMVALFTIAYAENGRIDADMIIFGFMNVFVSFLLLIGLLKYMSYFVLHKNMDIYQEINDPEFELLVQLKEKNVRSYYHAVHTAYFCEKIARNIGADEMLAKAGGYYHKIGKMRGNANLKYSLEIAAEYHFPEPLVTLLKEYGGKNTVLKSKEAAIVLLSDAMVSSVMFLFQKDKNAKLNFQQIAEVVFQKQMESGILEECELTMGQLSKIKRIFVEETLYYDFLR